MKEPLPLQRMRMGNQPIEDTPGYSQCVCAGLTFLFIEQPTTSLSLSLSLFRSLSLPLSPTVSPALTPRFLPSSFIVDSLDPSLSLCFPDTVRRPFIFILVLVLYPCEFFRSKLFIVRHHGRRAFVNNIDAKQ